MIVQLPTEEVAIHPPTVGLNLKEIESPIAVDTQVPPEADTVLPSLMVCPVLAVIVSMLAEVQINSTRSPSTKPAVVGNVLV